MVRNRLLWQAGAAAVAVALGASACGGSSSDKSSSASPSKSSGGAASDEIRNKSTAKGGELKLAADSDFDSLDPARTYYGYSIDFQRLFTRTLVTFKAEPGSAGTELAPDLATEVPKGTENNTVWTYKLKPGLKFEDGNPIKPEDIKYGVERIFATDQINGGPTYAICLLTKCDAAGESPYKGPYKDKKGLDSITTTGDSITFKLVKPFSDWNYVLTLPGHSPVEQAKDKGANYQSHPVSTGPYKIDSYTPNKSIMMSRNTNWDPSTDEVRTALPDTINVQIGAEASDIDNQILSGDVDYDLPDTGVQSATQAKLLNRDGSIKDEFKSQAQSNNTGYMRYLTLQTKVKPLDNVHCRRAIQYAVNKVDLQNARGGPITGGDIAMNTFPPSLAGAPKDPAPRYPDGADHKGDLTKAKDELKQCGMPDGFSITQGHSTTAKSRAVAAATQQALSRVGIKVNLKAADSSQYYSSFIGSPSNVKKNGLGIADAGWGPDFPTGYGFYSQIVDGRNIKPAGNSNYSELNDPKINSLIDESLTATDRDTFNQKYQDVDKQLMDDATMVPFVFDRALVVVSSRLKNVYFNQGYGHFDLATMGVQ